MAERLCRGLLIPPLLACLFITGCEQADTAGPPARARAGPLEKITTKTGIRMALIPAGDFLMGDDRGEDDERPAHKVHVAAFCMDEHEVTQRDYQALLRKNRSRFAGPDHPVDCVSWRDAADYCNMRSFKEGLEPCYDRSYRCNFAASGYRLPTEAEWEYACRAGAADRYAFGNDAARLGEYAWFSGNAAKTTHPVKQKRPNLWGLYDMHGNVWEWCHDRYDEAYYQKSPADSPRGPETGDTCALRGGCWKYSAERCRSAARHSETPAFAGVCFGAETYGFRCVRRAPQPTFTSQPLSDTGSPGEWRPADGPDTEKTIRAGRYAPETTESR